MDLGTVEVSHRRGVRGNCAPPRTWYQTATTGVANVPEDAMAERHTTAATDPVVSADIVGKLKLRIIDHCLPLWSTEGWDHSTGGFVERLGIDGRADRAAPRARASAADLFFRQGGRARL